MAEDEDSEIWSSEQREERLKRRIELQRQWLALWPRKNMPGHEPLSPEEDRESWHLACDILDLFADEWEQAIGASLREPSGEGMVFRHTAAAIRDALEGILPSSWRRNKKGKARGGAHSAKERVGVKEVSAFNALINDGLIPRGNYTSKIAGLFGVSTKSIQNWYKEEPRLSLTRMKEEILSKASTTEENAQKRLSVAWGRLEVAAHRYKQREF